MAFLSTLTAGRFVTARNAADAARDRGDWATALAQYKIATSIRPNAVRLLTQAGNMAKELGDLVQAELLYLCAIRASGVDEVHLQLGHLAKLRGRQAEALSHYTRAIEDNPMNANAKLERDQLQRKALGGPAKSD